MTPRRLMSSLRTSSLGRSLSLLSGLALFPVLLAASFTAATSSASTHLNRIHAAVVNDDQIVTVDGKTIPLGRQLTAALVTNHNAQNIGWTQTNASTAEAGLADGHFAVVVTIPKDFSAAATSLADPSTARPARLDVRSSSAAGAADPLVGEIVTAAAITQFNQFLGSAYLDNLYVGFSTLHDKLGDAADGAGSLGSGANTLAGGLGRLNGGADQLANGLQKLSGGANQLADGSAQLTKGLGRLTNGMQRIDSGTSQLPAAADQLQAGASALAVGNRELSQGLQQIADGVNSGLSQIGGLSQISQIITTIQQWETRYLTALQATAGQTKGLVEQLTTQCSQGILPAPTCAIVSQLSQNTSQLNTVVTSLTANLTPVAINQALMQVSTALYGIEELENGLQRAADGSKSLSSGSQRLAAGLTSLANGLRQLSSGIHQSAVGLAKATNGSSGLTQGATQIASGANASASGASQLGDGINQAKGGATKIAGGADKLANGLGKARNAIPNYNAGDRKKLSSIATQAVRNPNDGGLSLGRSLGATYAIALALAIAGLVAFLVLPAVPRNWFTSSDNSLRLALRAFRPCVSIVLFQSALLTLVIGVIVRLDISHSIKLLAVSGVAGLAIAATNQAMVALWQGRGRFVTMVILVVTAPASLISTAPGYLRFLVGLTPIGATLHVLRSALLDAPGLTGALLSLCVWFALGMAVTTVAIGRFRTAKPKHLRTRESLMSRDRTIVQGRNRVIILPDASPVPAGQLLLPAGSSAPHLA